MGSKDPPWRRREGRSRSRPRRGDARRLREEHRAAADRAIETHRAATRAFAERTLAARRRQRLSEAQAMQLLRAEREVAAEDQRERELSDAEAHDLELTRKWAEESEEEEDPGPRSAGGSK